MQTDFLQPKVQAEGTAARVVGAADDRVTAHRLGILSGYFYQGQECQSTANTGNYKGARAADGKIHSGMFLAKQSRI